MHKVHTGRLLRRKFQMLTRYIMEAITEAGKSYLCALFFLGREGERERERARGKGTFATQKRHFSNLNREL